MGAFIKRNRRHVKEEYLMIIILFSIKNLCSRYSLEASQKGTYSVGFYGKLEKIVPKYIR